MSLLRLGPFQEGLPSCRQCFSLRKKRTLKKGGEREETLGGDGNGYDGGGGGFHCCALTSELLELCAAFDASVMAQ